MKAIALIVVYFITTLYGHAQCPSSDSLAKRIVYLKETSPGTKEDFRKQLNELEPILQKMDGCSYKNDSTHAMLMVRIGGLYYLLGDFLKSIAYTKQSIKLISDNISKANMNDVLLVRAYNNLRFCYDSLGQKELNMAAADSCIATSIRLNKGFDFSIGAMASKTVSYLESGDYHRCIDYAVFSENFAKKVGFNLSTQTYFATWRLNSLVLLKNFSEAENVARTYIDKCLAAPITDTESKKNLGALYAQLAIIKIEAGNPKAAVDLYQKSVYYYKLAKNNWGIASTLNNTGDLYQKNFKQLTLALKYYREALTYSEKADPNIKRTAEKMNILNSIAGVFMEQKEYDSAFTYFQKSFDEIHPGISEAQLAKSPEKYLNSELAEYVSNLVLNKADAHMALYEASGEKQHLGDAITAYRQIDRIFDHIKFGQAEQESKLFWRKHIRRLYENAIKACYYQNNPDEAFGFFEKSKAVLLQDQLKEQKLLNNADLMKQTLATRAIVNIQLQLEDSLNQVKRDSLQAELIEKKEELDKIKNLIREKNQLYYQSFIDTTHLTIQNVRKKFLSDHQAVLEFFTGDSAVYLLCILKDKLVFQKLNKAIYDSLSNDFRRYLSNSEIINNQFSSFKTTASQLYKLLFAQLNIPAGRVIICPDGKYFPFEALIVSETENGPTYLLDNYALSYAYSARYLIGMAQDGKNVSARNFMGVAPVGFAAGWNLPTLSGSDASLNRVESHFSSSDSWTNAKATRNNFLQNFYQYKIIQLYTHAAASEGNKQPVIYFADSALLLSDLLYEKKPSTSLVVLSACETGTGKLYEGEGVFGFNRGFAAIGIPSTIASLWEVENSSTYKLTELFYQYLAKGMPVDVALQNAKKEFIKSSPREKQLPYYWAAPILTGQTDPIELKKNFLWIYVLAGAGMVFLFIVARVRGIARMPLRK